MSDLPYADDIILFISDKRDVQDPFEAVNSHAAEIGLRINALNAKVISWQLTR